MLDLGLNYLARSLSAKIGGDLAPFPGFPFEEWVGEVVIFEPGQGLVGQLPYFLGGLVAGQFGADAPLFDPQQGVARVGVDGAVFALLVQQPERLDNGQKLAQVVGAVAERSPVEQRFAAGGLDATILQVKLIVPAGRIHANAPADDFRRQHSRPVRFADVLLPAIFKGGPGHRFGGKGFVFGLRVAVDLLGARGPGWVDTRLAPFPDNVEFGFSQDDLLQGC